MKLDFNFLLKDLDNKPLEGANAGKILAQKLASATKGDSLKFFGWALKLQAGEIIDLDTSDQETLKGFIKGNEELTNLAKAQLEQVLIKPAKEEKTETVKRSIGKDE